MRKVACSTALLCFAFLLATGCDPCRNRDCTPEDSLALRFLSKADGNSLVGPGAPYSLAKLNITRWGAQGETPANYYADLHDRQAILSVAPGDTAFLIRLDTLPVDTLRLFSHREEDRCCYDVVIDHGMLNGQPVLQTTNKDFITLYK